MPVTDADVKASRAFRRLPYLRSSTIYLSFATQSRIWNGKVGRWAPSFLGVQSCTYWSPTLNPLDQILTGFVDLLHWISDNSLDKPVAPLAINRLRTHWISIWYEGAPCFVQHLQNYGGLPRAQTLRKPCLTQQLMTTAGALAFYPRFVGQVWIHSAPTVPHSHCAQHDMVRIKSFAGR